MQKECNKKDGERRLQHTLLRVQRRRMVGLEPMLKTVRYWQAAQAAQRQAIDEGQV
jgi:hypothetical protein